MDIKKQMLSFIERTNSLTKSPASTESSIHYSKIVLKNTPSSPSAQKPSGSESLKRPRPIRTGSNPSNSSSTRHSRQNSPARFASPSSRRYDFQALVLKTVSELLKVRATRNSKHIEIAAKEIKIMKQLREQVRGELKGRKIIHKVDDRKKYDQKILDITKESAQELIMLENKCKEIAEENQKLKMEIESSGEVKERREIQKVKKIVVVRSAEECFKEIERSSSGKHEIIDSKEPERIKSYLQIIESCAMRVVENTTGEDLKQVASAIAAQIRAEKEKLILLTKENERMLDYERGLRLDLEEKVNRYDN